MLVELAIGDAYGIAFEFDKLQTQVNDLKGYYRHSLYPIKPSHYTDDTQMSIAVAEALTDGRKYSKELFAEYFLKCFKRDERVGYASGFYGFLQSCNTTEDFLKGIKDNSQRNGAAMRSCSIGYLSNPTDVMNVAMIQASVTHNTTGGIMSSQAVALMVHYLKYNKGPKENLGIWIEQYLPDFKWSEEFFGSVPIQGMATAHAAISTVQRCYSLQEVLLRSVNYGGDTDTISAITMGAASVSDEIIKDLPQHLYDDLENGKYGINYLRMLDYKLNAFKNNLKVAI